MSDDRFAEDLQPDSARPSGPASRVRGYLAGESMWQEPNPELADSVVELIADEAARQPTGANRVQQEDDRPILYRPVVIWLGSAAVLVLIALGILAVLANTGPDEAGIEFVLVSTDLAQGAAADGEVITTEAGYAIRLEIDGLPPAPVGSFYQGWVRGEQGSVSIGTFHMRGDAPIGLWSGVALTDYHTLNITIQEEGAGPESSGKIVLTGEIPST